MAEVIVQPMVKNEDGSYDELIPKSAVSADIGIYASEDSTKGTIEDRLSQLEEVKYVNATLYDTYLATDVSYVVLNKKTNYVIAECHLVFKDYNTMYQYFGESVRDIALFKAPEGYIPSNSQPFMIGAYLSGTLEANDHSYSGAAHLAVSKNMEVDTWGYFRAKAYNLDYEGYTAYGTGFFGATFVPNDVGATTIDFQFGYYL